MITFIKAQFLRNSEPFSESLLINLLFTDQSRVWYELKLVVPQFHGNVVWADSIEELKSK